MGRESEIRRVTQVLCRRTRITLFSLRLALKTAIVEGLAQQIASGMVPGNLIDKKVVTLDLALMVVARSTEDSLKRELRR